MSSEKILGLGVIRQDRLNELRILPHVEEGRESRIGYFPDDRPRREACAERFQNDLGVVLHVHSRNAKQSLGEEMNFSVEGDVERCTHVVGGAAADVDAGAEQGFEEFHALGVEGFDSLEKEVER